MCDTGIGRTYRSVEQNRVKKYTHTSMANRFLTKVLSIQWGTTNSARATRHLYAIKEVRSHSPGPPHITSKNELNNLNVKARTKKLLEENTE